MRAVVSATVGWSVTEGSVLPIAGPGRVTPWRWPVDRVAGGDGSGTPAGVIEDDVRRPRDDLVALAARMVGGQDVAADGQAEGE